MKKTKFAFSLVCIVVAMLTGCSQVDSDRVVFKTKIGRPGRLPWHPVLGKVEIPSLPPAIQTGGVLYCSQSTKQGQRQEKDENNES